MRQGAVRVTRLYLPRENPKSCLHSYWRTRLNDTAILEAEQWPACPICRTAPAYAHRREECYQYRSMSQLAWRLQTAICHKIRDRF